jgi:glycine hydroxymethyltransferase
MEDFDDLFRKLIQATENHERYRDQECINMIASEGIKSPAVRQAQALCPDLEGRYAEGDNDDVGHVKKRYYQGQKYMSPIEDYATDLMKELFKASWADTRLVSGTHANLATFKGLSLATKNTKMVVTPLSCGAHISHDYTGLAGSVLGIQDINHVYNINEMNIDPDRSADVIRPRSRHCHFRRSLFLSLTD